MSRTEILSSWFRNALDFYDYGMISDRRNKQRIIPYQLEALNPESNLFPIAEEQLSAAMLSACGEYMNQNDMELIHTALALTLWAHGSHYRDSNEPYSIHPLNIAMQLATRYKQDAITIASALLHDTIEETSDEVQVTKNIIKQVLSFDRAHRQAATEVAETVETLSKYRGRFKRKESTDEENRLNIIKSLIDNPRVAIIKIFDRLHNMQTLHHLTSRGRREKIINETIQIYIPLAERLGLFEEAEELDTLCLQQQSEESRNLKTSIDMKKESFFARFRPETTLQEVSKIITQNSQEAVEFHYRKPGSHDIYRVTGAKREPTDADFYLNIDIVLNRFSRDDSRSDWGRAAMDICNLLHFSEEYDLIESINEIQFKQEVTDDSTDSLYFRLRRRRDGFQLRINIYPKYAYEEEHISLTDMYYRRSWRDEDLVPGVLDSDDEVAIRHYFALRKRIRYINILGGRKGLGPAQMVRWLEPRLPEDYMWVIGIDQREERAPWRLPKGSTIMDYNRDVFRGTSGARGSWPTIIRAKVNDKAVPLNYILQPGDRVTIFHHPNRPKWDPLWIHCFATDTDGPNEVRRKIEEILARGERDRADFMKVRVLQAGIWRIEQELPSSNRPSRVGLGRAMSAISDKFPEITETDFLFRVGMGDEGVSKELLAQIAAILDEPNRQVGVFFVYFKEDRPGQSARVHNLVRDMEISLRDTGAQVLGDQGPSVVMFYLDPDDVERHGEVIRKIIAADPICQQLGLVRIETRRVSELIG